MKESYTDKIKINKVNHQDSRKALSMIPTNSANLIILDPPLNLYKTVVMTNLEYEKTDLSMTYLGIPLWIVECYRILNPIGTVVCFTPSSQIYDGNIEDIIIKVMESTGFRYVDRIFECNYDFNGEITKELIKEHHSFTLLFKKVLSGFKGTKKLLMSFEELRGSERSVEYMKRLIEYTTTEGMTVLDPFAGSASIGEAALSLNRKYIGIELDKELCEEGNERLNDDWL